MDRRVRWGGETHAEEVIRDPDQLVSRREGPNECDEACSGSVIGSRASNGVRGYSESSVLVWEMEDHVHPGAVVRWPCEVCVVSALLMKYYCSF